MFWEDAERWTGGGGVGSSPFRVSQAWVWDPRCVPSALPRLVQGLVVPWLGVRASGLERIHSLCQSTAKQANSCFEHPHHLCNARRHHGVSEGAAFQKAHATGTIHLKWEQGGSCSQGRGVDQIKSMSKSRETTS